jgi:hypothetical protein
VREVLGVLATAGRLLLRHWPALLALSLLGAAVRNGTVWAATRLSDVSGQLGQLVLVLAPLGFLIPMVAMLSVCRRSLPALQVADAVSDVAPTERRRLRLVDVTVSLLVPFLAVYESLGLLEADLFRYRNSAAAENFVRALGDGVVKGTTASRLGIYPLQIALMIVVGAWVVRWALGQAERRLHLVALAFVGALVELYYTVQLASQLVVLRARGEPWLRDRVAAHWIEDAYGAVVDFLGPLGSAFQGLAHLVELAFGSFDAVVVVPVGWMAFAAVVLGYRLAAAERAEEPAAAPRRGPLKSLRVDVKERFSALFDGLRLLLAAGLLPMLVFSLILLLFLSVPALVHPALALAVGPQKFGTWLAINPFEIAAGFALSLMLTAPLLAAAVDWLVRTRSAARSEVAPTTPAPV